jgi:hypothetical protein
MCRSPCPAWRASSCAGSCRGNTVPFLTRCRSVPCAGLGVCQGPQAVLCLQCRIGLCRKRPDMRTARAVAVSWRCGWALAGSAAGPPSVAVPCSSAASPVRRGPGGWDQDLQPGRRSGTPLRYGDRCALLDIDQVGLPGGRWGRDLRVAARRRPGSGHPPKSSSAGPGSLAVKRS